MTDEAERKHDPAGRADEHADALLNAFEEIDRKTRTKNAMAHPAFCRGIAPARRRLPTLYRPSEGWPLMKAAIVSRRLRDWLVRTCIDLQALTSIIPHGAIYMSYIRSNDNSSGFFQ